MGNLGIQNKNPGNLRDPSTGSFRVFNTPEEGYQALIKDIEIKQSGKSAHIKPNQSLMDLANVWAPASDNNVPANWANNVAKTIGVSLDTPINKIPKDLLAKGIQVAEGTSTINMNPQQVDHSSGITADAFAQKIKAKHPEYNDLSNEELTQKVLKKYPQYKDMLTPEAAKQASYSSPLGTDPNATVAQQLKDNPVTRAVEDRQSGIFGDSTLGKVGNFLTASTQELGQHLGQGFAARGNIKDMNKDVDEFQAQSTRMMDAIDKAKAEGKDITRLAAAFKLFNQHSPQSKDYVSPEMQKQLEKGFWDTFKEVGGTALESFGTGKLLSKGKSLIGELVSNPLKAKEIAYNIPMEMKDFLKLGKQNQFKLLQSAAETAEGKDLFSLLKAMESLAPKVSKSVVNPGLLSRLTKYGVNLAAYEGLRSLFGDKVGGVIHKATGL